MNFLLAILQGMTGKTCRNRFAWNPDFVKKSPFRTLKRAKDALRSYKNGKSIGFTARSSLKSMGILPRSSGCYELGQKYTYIK